jgi:hypothetical protein
VILARLCLGVCPLIKAPPLHDVVAAGGLSAPAGGADAGEAGATRERERIAELEARLKQSSRNCSKPLYQGAGQARAEAAGAYRRPGQASGHNVGAGGPPGPGDAP